MKRIALLALLVCVPVISQAQTPTVPGGVQCTLTPPQSPEIRGIRLGMEMGKLMSAFPEETNRAAIENAIKESKKVNSHGAGRFDLRSMDATANPRFSGVPYMTVDILDERVTAFYVAYFGPRWTNVDQFITKLSDAFHLPPAESWKPEGDSRKTLTCNGFTVNADIEKRGINHHVTVRDTTASKIVDERRNAAEEKERQTFKP